MKFAVMETNTNTGGTRELQQFDTIEDARKFCYRRDSQAAQETDGPVHVRHRVEEIETENEPA